MSIYEYKATVKGCDYCRVKKLFSRFRACVVEASNKALAVEMKMRDYEKEGR